MLVRASRSMFKDIGQLVNKCWMSTPPSPKAEMVGKMIAHQKSLPRLPVPPLHPSLERYLLSVRPLLSEDEYHQTEKIVKQFGGPGGLGMKLHNMLKERAKVTENWLNEWWLKTAYLEFRMPVVVYSSPGLVFPIKEFNSVERQLRYAARLVAGALDYKRMIDMNSLPLDMMGGQPLDMSQYYKIFSTCRVPGIPSDGLVHFGADVNPPTHIVVVHNNHYFSVDVYGADGAPLNESQLLSQLEIVVSQSQHTKNPIGILTTEHRDTWAKAYKRLCKYDKVNKESVKIIQKAIFLLCLDKAVPDTGTLNRKTHVALQTIHGGGPSANSGNRWFDKTIQFIVGADGVVGLTYEHSPAEGPPITSMMDHIVDYLQKTKGNKWLPSTSVTTPKKLRFNLSSETLEDIDTAERDLSVLVSDLEMSCFTYETFGKDFVKSQRLSPDSFIQMAIQLAFYRIHGQIAATYESASTRKFVNGRTEIIRSASVEALDFCKLMVDKTAPAHVKAAAMRTAIDAHKEYTSQAVSGMGIDRMLLGLKKIAVDCGMNVPELFLDTGYTTSTHFKLSTSQRSSWRISGMGIDRMLLGLKKIAVDCGMNVPELFLDTGYTTSTHFKLSTSQVPSKVDAFMCYGPLVPDGYACCYNPRTTSINFGLSACNSSPETHSSNFMSALQESLTDMYSVLLHSQQSKL